MEKELGQIKFTETEDGYRVEVKGKSLRDAICCGCVPMFGGVRAVKVECCTPERATMDDCCLPKEDQK